MEGNDNASLIKGSADSPKALKSCQSACVARPLFLLHWWGTTEKNGKNGLAMPD